MQGADMIFQFIVSFLGKNSLENYCRSRKKVISSHCTSDITMLILPLNLLLWQFRVDMASFFFATWGGK